ncbi:F-box/LRR-repeat protein 20, partial [Elysia marginata]
MESKDEEDSGGKANQAKSIEELRTKRLAYFGSPDRLQTSNKFATTSLDHSQSEVIKQDKSQLKEESKDSEYARNKSLDFNDKTCHDLPYFSSPQRINRESQEIRAFHQIENLTVTPEISWKTPTKSTIMSQKDRQQRSFSESQDYDPVSVFNSNASLSELGLSTHRPESVSNGNEFTTELEGGIFVASPTGSGKMARDIFGDKASEQMRSALGDQGFEDLLSKVNKNLSLQREQSRPGQNNLNANNRADLTPFTINDDKHSLSQQVSATSSGSKGFQEWKDGEKKVRTLSRNYDQVTVPKNTKNSFSADQIYQQAFGAYQDPSLSGSFERDRYSGHYHNLANHPTWSDRFQHSYPMDFSNAPKRRFSFDSTTPDGVQSSSARYQLQMAPLACPPMHVPPPGYNSGHSGGVPMSPHLAASPASSFSFHGPAAQGYFFSGQFRSPYFTQNQYGHPSYPHQYVPQSPPSMPQSPHGFPYPPPTYDGSQHSVPRFPHGVPLHLPPPPIPPPSKQGAVHPAYSTALPYGRRNSLSFQGPEDGMKIPHPPPAPPALKLKDGKAEDHTGLEHRRKTIGGVHYPRPSHNFHHYNWEGEGPPNSYNLQRYFSSIEINHQGSPMNNAEPEPVLLSSRSVEGDFYRAKERKSTQGIPSNIFGDSEENNGENDDAVSCSSGFTSVTANTMMTGGKAGGLTRRLENLGVDLEHLRHLRVVDRKHDQEVSDANFEKLSKGIRYCPECSAANKAYMDWCLGCGEILIGVEPSLPGQRNKQNENSTSSNGNSSKSEKRSSRGSARRNKGNAGAAEHPASRDSSSRSSHSKSESGLSNSRHKAGRAESYTPQESPESGKGLSLSSSPVRHRREQEETSEEPKDSGRASSNDGHERFISLPSEAQKESEEDSFSADDLEVMDEEDFVEEEGVEYDYQDSEPNFFEQIKDPVLREFIISYRNKQIMKEGQEANPEDVLNQNIQDKSSKLNDSSEIYDETVKESMAVISKIAGTRTSQFNIELNAEKSSISFGKNFESASLERDTSGKDSKIVNDDNVAGPQGRHESRSDGKKRKKRKKKVEPMDVEIFGYEEIRQSRDSSRASNTHSIPLLNLAGSSEEESEEMTSAEDGDEDSVEVNDFCSDEEEITDNLKALSRNKNSFHSNEQESNGDEETLNETLSDRKNKGCGSHVQPHLSSAPEFAKGKGIHSQSKTRQTMTESFKGDAGASKGRVFHASQRGRPGEATGYQRHWARSSTAWSSYHPRELSTRSSLNTNSSDTNKRATRKVNTSEGDFRSWTKDSSVCLFQNGDRDGHKSRPSSGSSVSSSGGGASGIPVRQRPSSAEYNRRAPADNSQQRPSSAQVRSSFGHAGRFNPSASHTAQDQATLLTRGQPRAKLNNYMTRTPTATQETSNSHGRFIQASNGQSQTEDSSASPRLLCPELHRLPHSSLEEDEHADKLHAMAKNSYDKLQQMTPRISGGEVSIWQCLPDELWLYVFEFVSHGDLSRLMRSCQYFYRLANDETLWKYITVRPKLAVNDVHLAAIAQHQPLSLAMVMCNGRYVSQESLQNFFSETQGRLKELNICGCSHGFLGGAFVLETAAQYCHSLTHLDASYCSLTDKSLEAIAMCAERLESLCVNGFQSLSDACLLKVLKKHGRSLRTLELYACFSLSASSLRSLGEHCTNLKKLCLGSCNKLTDSAMVTLSAHLARVEELDLRGCKNLKNDCIRKIVRNCPRLNRLVLANCPHISDLALTEIATHLKTTL